MTRPDFTTPISTMEQAQAWLRALVAADMTFHLEDDPATIINGRTDVRLFSDQEAAAVRERVDELYALDWSTVGHECPIGFILEIEGM